MRAGSSPNARADRRAQLGRRRRRDSGTAPPPHAGYASCAPGGTPNAPSLDDSLMMRLMPGQRRFAADIGRDRQDLGTRARRGHAAAPDRHGIGAQHHRPAQQRPACRAAGRRRPRSPPPRPAHARPARPGRGAAMTIAGREAGRGQRGGQPGAADVLLQLQPEQRPVAARWHPAATAATTSACTVGAALRPRRPERQPRHHVDARLVLLQQRGPPASLGSSPTAAAARRPRRPPALTSADRLGRAAMRAQRRQRAEMLAGELGIPAAPGPARTPPARSRPASPWCRPAARARCAYSACARQRALVARQQAADDRGLPPGPQRAALAGARHRSTTPARASAGRAAHRRSDRVRRAARRRPSACRASHPAAAVPSRRALGGAGDVVAGEGRTCVRALDAGTRSSAEPEADSRSRLSRANQRTAAHAASWRAGRLHAAGVGLCNCARWTSRRTRRRSRTAARHVRRRDDAGLRRAPAAA